MLRLAFDFIITWRETRTRPNAYRTEKGQASVLGEVKIETEKPVTLQVTANGDDYRFNYSIDGKGFLNLGGTVSGDILSTNEAGGFTGAMIGLYATSVGY